jgi:hypothetical protein
MAKKLNTGEEKLPKYFEADEKVKPVLTQILKECADTFNHISGNDIKLLFTGEKLKLGRKPIKIKFIKQPYNFVVKNSEKAFVLINFEHWDSIIDSERVKILIEALLGIMTDDEGDFVKRDYDVQTYRELLKDHKEDYSRFKKVLPAEVKKAPDLELTSN